MSDTDTTRLDPFVPASPTDNDKLLAGLSYVSQLLAPAVLPAILLFTDEAKRSPFLKRHAVQSLALLVVAVVFEIVAAIVNAVAAAVVPCLSCGLWLLFVLPAAPLIYYGVKAFQGQDVEIPYLTKLLTDNHLL